MLECWFFNARPLSDHFFAVDLNGIKRFKTDNCAKSMLVLTFYVGFMLVFT